MKTSPHQPNPTGGAPQSRPPPAVHAGTEPEYDIEQLKRRANQVTQVLEHILQEQVLLPGKSPGLPPQARP